MTEDRGNDEDFVAGQGVADHGAGGHSLISPIRLLTTATGSRRHSQAGGPRERFCELYV